MSLTGHIKQGRGDPVFDWFATHFPATSPVSTEVNRALRGGGANVPCVIPPTPGTNAGLVGTAVGYVLSAHLRAGALDSTVATCGALGLDRFVRTPRLAPSVFERMTVQRIEELEPSRRELAGVEWNELLRLMCVLARCEQMVRAGLIALDVLVPLFRGADDLEALSRAAATPETLADLDALSRATLTDHLHLREVQDLRIGPDFMQSPLLGGADADIIAGGVLIELKSSAQDRIVGRRELWQMLGYVLSDGWDQYKLRQCTVAALRRRRSYTWELQDLADALAGGPTAPIERWRADFEELLGGLPAPRHTSWQATARGLRGPGPPRA
jgi:hypothetical protein